MALINFLPSKVRSYIIFSAIFALVLLMLPATYFLFINRFSPKVAREDMDLSILKSSSNAIDSTSDGSALLCSLISKSRADIDSQRKLCFDSTVDYQDRMSAIDGRKLAAHELFDMINVIFFLQQFDDYVRNANFLSNIIAIKLFKTKVGRLPITLDDLRPTLRGQLKVDPLSGQPFLYDSDKKELRSIKNKKTGKEFFYTFE